MLRWPDSQVPVPVSMSVRANMPLSSPVAWPTSIRNLIDDGEGDRSLAGLAP